MRPAGHRQTAEERRRAYLSLMGFPESAQYGADATHCGGSGGGAALAQHIPKACPHCGTLVEAPKGERIGVAATRARRGPRGPLPTPPPPLLL